MSNECHLIVTLNLLLGLGWQQIRRGIISVTTFLTLKLYWMTFSSAVILDLVIFCLDGDTLIDGVF